MRDQVFTGRDVAEALAAAAAALALPQSALRYVVLEGGSAGGRGLQPTPARVAVLLEESPPERQPAGVEVPREDPRAAIRAAIRTLADAAGIDVGVEVEEDDAAVLVHLSGPDQAFFFGREGRGEVLRALEHLLQRSHGAALHPRPIRLRCQGFQERRDAALAEEARRLAAEVRADGAPRTTEPLNSYERRVVHVALNGEPGITTFSVGEGAVRRVTVARAAPADDSPEPS